MSMATALDDTQRRAIRAAAQWYARLCDEQAGRVDALAHEAWLAEHPTHVWAWRQLDRLRGDLDTVPPELSSRALQGARDARHLARRRLLLTAALAGGGWLGWRLAPWREWGADLRTAKGEQRHEVLADGTRLMLDTDSALDVRYTPDERVIRLQTGRVMIRTGADTEAPARPFVVETPQGRLWARGTRFSVSTAAESSCIAVFEHAVDIQPAVAPEQRAVPLQAGWRARFDDYRVETATPLATQADAWTRGLLVVDAWPLSRLLAELSRYRPGHLGHDASVADWRISGAFPLLDSERALQAIERALPVQVRRRTDYWVRVEARAA